MRFGFEVRALLKLKGMIMLVFTEKELGEAIKLEVKEIVVRGEDLVKKVLRLKNTGKVAWGLCLAGLGAAVGAVLAAPVVPVTPVIWTTFAGPVVVTALGLAATKAAVLIAVAGGGVAALNKLRKYQITEQTPERLVLKRK